MAENNDRKRELTDDEAVKEVIKIGERFERQARLAEEAAKVDRERCKARTGQDDRATIIAD
jgi:hypothetical protein